MIIKKDNTFYNMTEENITILKIEDGFLKILFGGNEIVTRTDFFKVGEAYKVLKKILFNYKIIDFDEFCEKFQ